MIQREVGRTNARVQASCVFTLIGSQQSLTQGNGSDRAQKLCTNEARTLVLEETIKYLEKKTEESISKILCQAEFL